MDQCLGDIGFRPFKFKPCVCVYEYEDGLVMPMPYVDGLSLLAANKLLLNKLQKLLMDRFEMTVKRGPLQLIRRAIRRMSSSVLA